MSLVLLLCGCGIRKDIHQAALDTIAQGQDQLGALEAELVKSRQSATDLDLVIDEMKAQIAALQDARDQVLADNSTLRAQLEGAAEGNQDLAQRNEQIAAMLDEANRALAAARERQRAAEERDRIFRQVKDQLQNMIDAGKLSVRIARGRLVIDLKQDILFPSGSAALSDVGQETLAEVAAALAEFADRRFQVEGHTDNLPIATDRYPSNWELSTARAVSVVKLFQGRGMTPGNLSAAGFGEFQPRADNGSPEGRALNRRIEVIMQPDLQILPDLVDSL